MAVDYLLSESGVGYAIFKVKIQADTIGNQLKEVQSKVQDLSTFGKMVELVSFAPFQGASHALENANDISEGIVSNFLKTLIATNIPNAGKKHKPVLGVADKALAGNIKADFPHIECETSETSNIVADLLRGLRLHSEKLLNQLQEGDIDRSQRGVGHAYSRAKVKFSVQKNDNHIIQAIATLDQLDKDVNQFSMRVREWYSWHFPELVKIVSDNQQYSKLVIFIGDKKSLSEEKLYALAELVNDDETVAKSIIEAARVSMGRDISEQDMATVLSFANRAVKLANYRKDLHNYLVTKMGVVAPNLGALIGETIGARLISKAGSLTNLAKYPASTVQILGAEKALFRALKTKGNTPKYGLIYHSSFIGRAPARHKGRISRFLANKTSVAARIDQFSEVPTAKFGEALKKQVDDRVEFYTKGTQPMKNIDVMQSAMESVRNELNISDPTAAAASDEEMADGVTSQATQQAERRKAEKEEKKAMKKKKKSKSVDVKKDKKDKKRKHGDEKAGGEEKKKKKKIRNE
ncbi:Nop domain-containing protein [Rhizodiscina lignyota]|uniref:Nucleolar protein 56 n=1 Tax=Rhizodiscina lignyota TaxID=1504668 RepID=A0A9P4IDS6_9PEZI|nr:Nop domain-containing protein [Rhizodiscina lignyota]